MSSPHIDKNSATLDLPLPYFAGANLSSGYAQGFEYLRRCFWNSVALAGGDTLAISLAVILAGAIRHFWLGDAMIPIWSWLIIPIWWVVAFSQRLFPSWGVSAVEELRRLVILLAGLYGSEAAILVLAKESEKTSRLVLLGAFMLSLVFVPTVRAAVKGGLIKNGLWGVPTVIYAESKTAAAVIEALLEQRDCGYIPIGIFNDEPDSWGTKIEGVPVFGRADLALSGAPVAILATRGLTCHRAIELLDGPLASYRHVIIQPDLFDVQSLWVRASDLGGLPGLELSFNLLDPMARWSKHVLELILILVTAPFWIPLCLLLALLIWLEDRVSPIYSQIRIGKNGKQFRTLKFRTMVPNAEQVLKDRLATDPDLVGEWDNNFKLRNDPRITRVGRILRKTSLDELPQLLNVLKGEMSLVGPRPLPLYHHLELTSQARKLRERVKPGLTGLWQVSGRSQVGTAGMEKWDTFYARNWSVWLDLVILIRTVRVVSNGTGAY